LQSDGPIIKHYLSEKAQLLLYFRKNVCEEQIVNCLNEYFSIIDNLYSLK